MSGAGSSRVTRSQAVSDPYPPTLTRGRRVRSSGAALAGGSPLSSPSPSSGGGSSPQLETSLTPFPPPQQDASSPGAPSSNPRRSSGARRSGSEPIGARLEDAGMGSPSPEPILTQDVEMESASTREIAKALRDLAARLPVPRDGVERVVDEAKAKIHAATSDSGIVVALPHQFQSDVREYLKGYRAEVEALASARSSLSKLRKHRHAKSYPAALNSLKTPSIQFSRAFINAPATEGHRGAYSIAAGTNETVFEQAVDRAVKALKDEVLKRWVSEKEREVTFLESKGSAARAITNLEEVVHAKLIQLRARWDYLVPGTPAHTSMVQDTEAHAAISHALSATIITRVNSLVLDDEDKRLEIAIKKMAIEKPAVLAGSQATGNDLSELKKMVGDLAKKVELNSKKVRDNLLRLLCVCAGHLSLTRPLLESLLTGLVESGWEEVGREESEGEGEERKGRQDRKEKGQEGPSRQGRRCRSVQGQERQGQEIGRAHV